MAGPVLTQNLDASPWVEVFHDPADLPVGTARLRMYRFSEGRTWLVRGGVDVAPGVAALDFEVPFRTPAMYRAECFDAAGVSLGFTETSEITVAVGDVWVHNPLDPTVAVNLGPYGLLSGSGAGSRPTVGDTVWPDGAVVGRRVGSTRRGVVGGRIGFAVETLEVADELQAMVGDYVMQQVGVLCVRTPPPVRMPRTLFASVRDVEEQDVNVAWGGGSRTDHWFSYDEVSPPFPGLVTPLLTYGDVDEFYGSYAAADAAYATYTGRDRDYSLAGFASS